MNRTLYTPLFRKLSVLTVFLSISLSSFSQNFKTIVIDIKNCETNQPYDSLKPFLIEIFNSNIAGFETIELNGQNQITIDSIQFDSASFQNNTNYIRIGFLNKFDLDY